MCKKTLKIMDAHGLAEMICAMQNTNNEISFATCFEVDEDGAVLESNTGDWWGAKFAGAFDGTSLLFGAWGGGDWYVFDATYSMTTEELKAVISEMFQRISADKVCVEEAVQNENI